MTERTCSVNGCDRKHFGHGLCKKHLRRLSETGTTSNYRDLSVEERFWSWVQKTEAGCWIWTGARHVNGYGHWGKPSKRAHRVAYEMLVGSIPDGQVLDHICRNPPCVNPEHLEPVSQQENVHRGYGAWMTNARKTHCAREGHPLSGENLHVKPDGRRVCKACRREGERLVRERRAQR